MIRFASPHMLWLLALVPLAVAIMRARRPAAVTFSSVALTDAIGASLRAQLAWLPALLRILALTAVIIAAARPQHGTGQTRTSAEGVAIMGVVDRSYSMANPMRYGGEELTRLDVVKRIFTEFVTGAAPGAADRTRPGDALPGRPHDLIGLITFAALPETVVPLTRIHDPVVGLVDQVELVPENSALNHTAIGDALALAAARLRNAETDIRARADIENADDESFTIRSKAIVLLTDGEENYGDIAMSQAAELCAELGIKIYAIGIGGDVIVRNPLGQAMVIRGGSGQRDRALKALAESTGGKSWSADDADALRRIYAEIDDLEKTEVRSVEYTTYDERFTIPATAALTLLALELILSLTLFRRLP